MGVQQYAVSKVWDLLTAPTRQGQGQEPRKSMSTTRRQEIVRHGQNKKRNLGKAEPNSSASAKDTGSSVVLLTK
jgi:hypothetical protein